SSRKSAPKGRAHVASSLPQSIYQSQGVWAANTLRWIIGGLVLGVMIAAIFLFPMLLQLNTIVVNTPSDNVPDTLQRNFLDASDLFLLPQPIDMSDLSHSIPHTFGLVGGVLGAVGFIALIWRRRFVLAGMLRAGCVLAIVLALDVSVPILPHV